MLFALDPVVSQAFGAKDHEGVARGVQRGVMIAIMMAILVSLLLLPGEAILGALRQPGDVVPATAEYTRRRVIGVLPFFLFTVFRQTLQAMGPVRPILWAALIANCVNIIGNWILIFGNLGAPKLGVNGSGYSTAVAMWVMMIAALIIGWPKLRTALTPWRREALLWVPIRRLLLIGIPIGTQWFFESFAFGLTALFMGWMGTVSLAGHEIALNMASLTYMVPLGFSGAAAAIVGRAVGRGDIVAAKRDAMTAIACSVGFMCVSAMGFVFAPRAGILVGTGSWSLCRVHPAILAVDCSFSRTHRAHSQRYQSVGTGRESSPGGLSTQTFFSSNSAMNSAGLVRVSKRAGTSVSLLNCAILPSTGRY